MCILTTRFFSSNLQDLIKDNVFLSLTPSLDEVSISLLHLEPAVDRTREQVLSITVWAHFSHIPSILQPMIGLDWLASLVGEVKCFDAIQLLGRNLFMPGP